LSGSRGSFVPERTTAGGQIFFELLLSDIAEFAIFGLQPKAAGYFEIWLIGKTV
jgi:hypothetical protein